MRVWMIEEEQLKKWREEKKLYYMESKTGIMKIAVWFDKHNLN